MRRIARKAYRWWELASDVTMRVAVIAATFALGAILVACAASTATSEPGSTVPAASTSPEAHGVADSGIYGSMIAARGNAPSNLPSVECVKVLDSTARNVVARGECSGPWRQFRVPLAPGSYVVEVGGHWESRAGAVSFVPNRRAVEVKPRQWMKLAPPPPPAPLP